MDAAGAHARRASVPRRRRGSCVPRIPPRAALPLPPRDEPRPRGRGAVHRRLGFRLIARYGRVGERRTHHESGVSWDELDAMGFKLRLTELESGAVNVVLQPGQWPMPRVDHLGVALDEDEFQAALERATGPPPARAGASRAAHVHLHPCRLPAGDAPAARLDRRAARLAGELSITELHLRSDDPARRPTRCRGARPAGRRLRRRDRRLARAVHARRPAGPAGARGRALRLIVSVGSPEVPDTALLGRLKCLTLLGRLTVPELLCRGA